MFSLVTGNWWAPASSGAVSIVVGVVALIWPTRTLEVLVQIFGVYVFVQGVIWLAFAGLAADASERWWPLVVNGVVGIGLGVLMFAEPRGVAVALVSILGAWAVLTGALALVAAIRFRQIIDNDWLLGASGVLSLVLGVAVLAQPNAVANSLVLIFGAYSVLVGAALLWLGMRLRGLREPRSAPATPELRSATR